MTEVKKKSTRIRDDSRWSDKERLDFATALQRFGSADTKKIASYVKTKSENAVKAHIALHMTKMRKKVSFCPGRRGRRGRTNFQHMRPRQGETDSWPALRKWQKIAQNQQADSTRKMDYSTLIIPQMWERFSEEADEPEDPECVDMKKLYHYVAQCMHGNVPPELPPKESAALLMYMRLVRHALINMDLTEETKFLQDFEQATTYVPFRMKDEFKKGANQVCPSPGTQPIPEDVFAALSRHRKVVQSFNPLAVPLWLLEQESLVTANPGTSSTQQE